MNKKITNLTVEQVDVIINCLNFAKENGDSLDNCLNEIIQIFKNNFYEPKKTTKELSDQELIPKEKKCLEMLD